MLTVRLTSIRIQNFKNVGDGSLNFENLNKSYRASILGLYGQNGSGKTALIDALRLLKTVMSGERIDPHYCDLIYTKREFAHLSFEFKVKEGEQMFTIFYEFKYKTIFDESEDKKLKTKRVELFDEDLQLKAYGLWAQSKIDCINTNSELPFRPEKRFRSLVRANKNLATDLIVARKISQKDSKSFVFSKDLLQALSASSDNIEKILSVLPKLLIRLKQYADIDLFIIGMKETGLISFGQMPLSVRYEGNGFGASGTIPFNLQGTSLIPKTFKPMLTKIVSGMNVALSEIVPGLRIGMRYLGERLSKDGNEELEILLTSQKDEFEIPLELESDGIKKIISILQLLIFVYNKESITVVVDELDSGIFEFLLGELLKIISEKGRGQLIFTSHNLRPLETIDKGFIAFTTTDPQNRYLRLTNIKMTNNMRDYYFRYIMLNAGSDLIYKKTNNSKIAMAFNEAMGEMDGSN